MKECPNCKKQLADNALSCPDCGYNYVNANTGKSCLILVVLFVIVAFLIGGCVNSLFTSEENTTNSANNNTLSTETVTTSPNTSINPQEACSYLDNIAGLNTNGYKSDGMGGYFCASDYKMLDNLSNIAYYVEGSADNVEKMYIVLNANKNSDIIKLNNELINASNQLAKKVLNQELSAEIISNIKNGKEYSGKIGKNEIEIIKNDWSTGKGSDIQFIIHK